MIEEAIDWFMGHPIATWGTTAFFICLTCVGLLTHNFFLTFMAVYYVVGLEVLVVSEILYLRRKDRRLK